MKYLLLILSAFFVIACQKSSEYMVSKNRLGNINNTTKISELKSLLLLDSVDMSYPRDIYGKPLTSLVKEVKVYDTSNNEVLLIKPDTKLDTMSLISSIRILSERYKTKNGIGINSNFEDVQEHHAIGLIQSSPNSIVLMLSDINALVSFDRSVLPGDIRFDNEAEIKLTMIPNDAKVNRFWINFESEKDE